MKWTEDRVLHFALEEVIGELSPPDVTAAVMCVVDGGGGGGGHRGLESAVWVLFAVLALLSGAVVVGLLLGPPQSEPLSDTRPLATAAHDIPVLNRAGRLLSKQTVAAGESAVSVDEDYEIRLSDTVGLVLNPPACVTFQSEDGVTIPRLVFGNVRNAPSNRDVLRIQTPHGLIVIGSWGEATVDVALPRPLGLRTVRDVSLSMSHAAGPSGRTFKLTCHDGPVTFIRGEVTRTLSPGESITVTAEGRISRK